MSDLVFFDGLPAIKCGPGRTERSHTPDEFVLASEVRDGARFYGALIRELAALASTQEGTSRGQTLVQG
jgi:acetylornithine deacetylase